jgi:hypothetical protein
MVVTFVQSNPPSGFSGTHLKQKPVRAIEVNRQLSAAITSQFVTSTWEVAHSFKRRRRTHIVEPPSDQFGSMSTVAAH